MKKVKEYTASQEVTDAVEYEGADPITISIIQVPSGFVFTYSSSAQGHNLYGDADGNAFPTIEAAEAAANDLSDEAPCAEFTGKA